MDFGVCTLQMLKFARRAAVRALLCMIVLGACVATSSASGNEPEREVQIRAAFLLNFVKFTEWPQQAFASEEADFVVAVVGPDPFGRVLEQTFAALKVQGHKVVIRRWTIPDRAKFASSEAFEAAVAELRRHIESAHLAYFTLCNQEQLDLSLKGTDTSSVLTVGSDHRCAVSHTALALDRDGDRVVFYANVDTLKSLKVRVSSKVLSLAKRVEGKTPQGDRS
ncbi:MAG: YfiR family protein [Leptolyngbya sp. PLA3]|nr:MAG: YfiR family protein [Cyanobacteria bacterium CYA]MCE7967309.1 YfiR family protein [Leptolyngbya sp. PL-A3]